MKMLAIAVLVTFGVALGVAAAGCKEKSGGDTLAKMAEFRDRICGCKDKACTDKLTAEMTAWTQETGRTGILQNLSNEDLKRSTAISTDITNCMTKIVADSVSSDRGAGNAPAAGAGGASGTTEAGAVGSAAGGPPSGAAEGSAAAPGTTPEGPPPAGSAK